LTGEEGIAGSRRRIRPDVRVINGDRPAHRRGSFVSVFVTPTDNRINADRHNDQANQAVKNLFSMVADSVSQTIGEQHGGVAKAVMFQFARAFLVVLSQGTSSCKNAQ